MSTTSLCKVIAVAVLAVCGVFAATTPILNLQLDGDADANGYSIVGLPATFAADNGLATQDDLDALILGTDPGLSNWVTEVAWPLQTRLGIDGQIPYLHSNAVSVAGSSVRWVWDRVGEVAENNGALFARRGDGRVWHQIVDPYFAGQTAVTGWVEIAQISAGWHSGIAGLGADGRVRVAVAEDYSALQAATNWSGITQIAMATDWICGLSTNGAVVGTTNAPTVGGLDTVAIAAGSDQQNPGGSFLVWLDVYGQVHASANAPTNAISWTNCTQIAACQRHMIARRADGTVLSASAAGGARDAVGGWSNVVAVASGGTRSLGLRADGKVLTAGASYAGGIDPAIWREMGRISAAPSLAIGITRRKIEIPTDLYVATNGIILVDVATGLRHQIVLSNGTVIVRSEP